MRNRWKDVVFVLLGFVGIGLGSVESPLAAQEGQSKDWNAAVGYWQAFALMPVLNEQDRAIIEAIQESPAEPLPSAAKELTERSSVALAALSTAARVERCDWQLDYAAGPNLLLPHLQKARDLARLANLRARYRFATGDRAGAIEDVKGLRALGRAAAVDPLLIGLLVGAAIDRMAIDTVAAYLPELTEAERTKVAALFDDLPTQSRLALAMKMEREVFGGWLQAELERLSQGKAPQETAKDFYELLAPLFGQNPRGGKSGLESLEQATLDQAKQALAAYVAKCEELESILELPFEERFGKLREFEASHSAAADNESALSALPRLFLPPDLGRVAEREEAGVKRQTLLLVALAGVANGKDGIESAAKARGLLVACDGGNGVWNLSTRLTDNTKAETLVVGGGYRIGK